MIVLPVVVLGEQQPGHKKKKSNHERQHHEHEEEGIVWENLSITTTDGRHVILHPFSGRVPAGQVCGLLGPSGAGKSSFMSALASGLGGGALSIDGQVYSYHPSSSGNAMPELYRRIPSHQVAWLQQHDDFFTMLTAEETLQLAAFLELPHLDETARQALVEQQLAQLGLTKVAHRRVGDASSSAVSTMTSSSSGRISGGERRRLAVALELLTEKHLLLADEVRGFASGTKREKSADASISHIATFHDDYL